MISVRRLWIKHLFVFQLQFVAQHIVLATDTLKTYAAFLYYNLPATARLIPLPRWDCRTDRHSVTLFVYSHSFFQYRHSAWVCLEGNEVSTSIASDSRLKSSITFNSLNRRPSTRLSLIKSMLHIRLGASGITKACFTRSGKRFFALRRICSFIIRYTRRTRLWFQLYPLWRSLW